MKKAVLFALMPLFAVPQAQAHELWIEDNGTAAPKVFIGEPDFPAYKGGDPEFPRLKLPHVFRSDEAIKGVITRKEDHLEVAIPGAGDVRLRDDSVFDSDLNEDGSLAKRIYYARAGRNETNARLDFEIVPLTPGGSEFQILFKGKPAAREGVRIIRPDGWLKNIKSDDSARFSVPVDHPGRYLLFVDHNEMLGAAAPGEVSKITHITTLTFFQR